MNVNEMAIKFFTEEVESPAIDKKKLTAWIREVAKHHEQSVGELTYIFCNDEKILEVNRQYLQHDFYTDIITFDYSDKRKISGDIFISLDTVLSNSQMYQTEFIEELHRVIIHGVLHLCGINDESEEEEIAMRSAENNALAVLKTLD